jgi:ligand-binding SRPBCC domain-containing protein
MVSPTLSSPVAPAAADRITFVHHFVVRAPLAAVSAFHRDASGLQRLTPPPIVVQFNRVEPLAEGSLADFTLWLGPFPVRWVAVHSEVDPLSGFTDTQAAGPSRYWRHTHRFEVIDSVHTRVSEHIEHAHHPGWRGLVSRFLFNSLALRLLFTYRGIITRRALERSPAA